MVEEIAEVDCRPLVDKHHAKSGQMPGGVLALGAQAVLID